MKNLFSKIWLFIIALFPIGKRYIAKQEAQNIAAQFVNQVDETAKERHDCRTICKDTPFLATPYEWLFGRGFNPTKPQLNKIEEAAKQARQNGWKFMTSSHVAKAMVGSPKSLDYVATIGLDSAIERTQTIHWGTIFKYKLPGRNQSCGCGSGKKFKQCCIHKFN